MAGAENIELEINRAMSTLNVILILWLRDMKRFMRSPSRIIGSITLPLLILVGLGAGFGRSRVPGIDSVNYLTFLVPGMIGMTILFGGVFSGMSVLWDRQYGFLKEIMVAPVPRVAIVIGRIASGSTTGIIQATIVALFATAIGFGLPSLPRFMLALIFMVTHFSDIHRYRADIRFTHERRTGIRSYHEFFDHAFFVSLRRIRTCRKSADWSARHFVYSIRLPMASKG